MPSNESFSHSSPPTDTPANWVSILEQPLFTPRKLRLVCIGAGFSGLILAHKIKHELKMDDMIDLQIYEKNPEIGGTWFENRYPGAACDVPAHVYVFPFEPNPNWSSFYVHGPEIWQYMKDTAVKWGLEKFVSFNSRVNETVWDDEVGKWKIKVDYSGNTISDECDVLVNASGFLNKWSWPTIEGLEDFKGKRLHTAAWDESYDWTGKRVAIIGNGSSAIQLLPEIQRTAKEVVNYIRNPTWIATNYLQEFAENGKFVYTEEKKKELRENPEMLFEMRKKLEHGFNQFFHSMIDGTPAQKAMDQTYRKKMEDALGGNPELIQRLVPEFNVGCRRLTPGDGYLDALHEKNVRVELTPISRITETGIATENGPEDYDLIVCATGFDVSFRPSWNLVGRNGVKLSDAWKVEPKGYFGMCAADMPNYFIYAGPNSPVAHGVLMGSMDAMTLYILKWCRKIATEDIKSITVKPEVVDDLSVWSQEFLKRTVWAGECRSWYKNSNTKGNITALHAGSVIHYREMLHDLRGEDFDIKYRSRNEFRFLGNGFTQRDANGDDLAYYLKR
ncbi:uncharacterized protein N7496_006312 [Penicillium cataractarum]|uniref:FAD/NAD(P)-binding domain-containing protein n=1 Tax=Penicillium cataractarum TaxID=2100454 RepID=A0A9W9S1K4_9EURO|nr:uncharacterized protein N7496_006312 [Penicillium cataractarum]KAJ5370220.1 hypothetical protein N7496_006312 [Penicillium cataractarum]